MKNEYEIFVEQFEGKRAIGKPGRRRKINLKDIGAGCGRIRSAGGMLLTP